MSETTGPKAPRWAWWVATGFGSGYLKPAPGTWGSLAALLVWCTLIFTPWYLPRMPYRNAVVGAAWVLTPILALLAIWSSNKVVDESGLKDPGFIVIDEWAGLWIALFPVASFVSGNLYFIRVHHDPYWVLILPIATPFALFRIFDILKPWPVHQLQALPRGWGVVVDDLMAGLYAALLTALAVSHFPVGPGKG